MEKIEKARRLAIIPVLLYIGLGGWLTDFLFRRANGKDEVTGEPLQPDAQIHHIQHRAKGGSDDPDNLVVINRDTHKAFHEGEPAENFFSDVEVTDDTRQKVKNFSSGEKEEKPSQGYFW